MPTYLEQPVVVGGTPDFTLYARKNGVTWNITGGTVLLYLWDPDGNAAAGSPFTCTVSSGSGGIAQYQVTDDTIIDAAGEWTKQWHVTVGSLKLPSEKERFEVFPGVGDA